MNNSLVFHYTSIDALRNLIESVEKSLNKDAFLFRASNILYMNDPNEFTYGRKIFVKTLLEIEKELAIPEEYCLSKQWVGITPEEEKQKDKEYIKYLQRTKGLPYVLSFSLLEDSLPMWLNYGNKGRGVCLAFQDNREQPIERRSDGNVYETFYTSDVYYDSIQKNSSLYNLLIDTMKEYKNDIQDGNKFGESYFEVLLKYVAPFVKTTHYRSECEVRVAKTIDFDYRQNEKVSKFRCNSMGNLIPYIDVEINIEQLKYIILGPLVDFELTKLAINMMTNRYCNREFNIAPSSIQYRDY